jgi:hypothetical protein
MSRKNNPSENQICYYLNDTLLNESHFKHYMGMLQIQNLTQASVIKIEFAAQKKKIKLSFDTVGSISETESQAIEMARMYLMQRIMYWKALN